MESDSSDLNLLMNMGFSMSISQAALSMNDTIESAVNWLFENHHIASGSNDEDFEIVNEEMKMVMIVRTDLGMRPGYS